MRGRGLSYDLTQHEMVLIWMSPPRACSQKEIVAGTGMKTGSVKSTIQKMYRAGEITSTGTCGRPGKLYSLTELGAYRAASAESRRAFIRSRARVVPA